MKNIINIAIWAKKNVCFLLEANAYYKISDHLHLNKLF